MGRIYVYRRRFPGTDKPDVFIVQEYANRRNYHHRQFSSEESANKYLETAVEKAPAPPKMLKDYPTAKENLAKILSNDKYQHAKRKIA